MRNIVLITRENSERVTHVSVIFCHDYHEAAKLCHLVNRLFGAGNEKLIARCISTGREYCLEKGSMFNYDDLVKLDDRTIQKIMREISSEVLIPALFDSSEAIRERFLSNMSKRAAGMLLEDMEYSVPACESEIEEAKQHILDAYDYVLHEAKGQREFQSIFDKYEKETEKQNGTDSQDKYLGEKYIALVFRGKKEIAETVSAVGFDSMETQVNFCEFINRQELPDGSFIFARETEQMIEYEIAKPLLACFDQIARWDGIIVGTALRKVRPEVIASALRGLDKESRERIIENLPHRVADDVIDWIDTDEKSDTPRLRRNTRQSRKKIVNTILGVEKQFKKGKFSCGFLLKD